MWDKSEAAADTDCFHGSVLAADHTDTRLHISGALEPVEGKKHDLIFA